MLIFSNLVFAQNPSIRPANSKYCQGDTLNLELINFKNIGEFKKDTFLFIQGKDTLKIYNPFTINLTDTLIKTINFAFSNINKTGDFDISFRIKLKGGLKDTTLTTIIGIVPKIQITKDLDSMYYACQKENVLLRFADENPNSHNQWQLQKPGSSAWENLELTPVDQTLILAEKFINDNYRYRAVINKEYVCYDTTRTAILRIDTIPPKVKYCPPDIPILLDENKCDTIIDLPDAIFEDECTGGVNYSAPRRSDGKSNRADPFSIGVWEITFETKDRSGNPAECKYNVIVESKHEFVLKCNNDTTLYLDNNCNVRWRDKQIETEKFCSIDPILAYTYQNRNFDKPGKYPIIFEAFQNGEVVATCTTTVTVIDTIKKSISKPKDTFEDTDPNSCTRVVKYASPTTNSCDPGRDKIKLISGFLPGAEFPIGTTVNSFEIEWYDGKKETVSFNVTINNVSTPTVTPPDSINVTLKKGKCKDNIKVPLLTNGAVCGILTVINDRTGTSDASDIYLPGESKVIWTVTGPNNFSKQLPQVITVKTYPSAVRDSAPTDQDVPVDIPILANDFDCVSSTQITFQKINPASQPMYGISNYTAGNLLYTPNPGFYGMDSLQYIITNNFGLPDTAWVIISVKQKGIKFMVTPPSNIDTTLKNGKCQDLIDIPQLKHNGTSATVNITNNRTFTSNASGVFGSGKTTVRWTVTGFDNNTQYFNQDITVKTYPTAVADNDTTKQDMPVGIAVLNNDFICANAGTLSFVGVSTVSQPKNGTAKFINGKLVYSPKTGFSGNDSLEYIISNGFNLTDTAWVKIVVLQKIADPPVEPPGPCRLLIPNGFSPNGDGIADRFYIRCIEEYKQAWLQVFNRYGQLMFSQINYGNTDIWGDQNAFWDGRPNEGINLFNTILPPGTYYYILDLANGTKPRTGSIYLNTNINGMR